MLQDSVFFESARGQSQQILASTDTDLSTLVAAVMISMPLRSRRSC
jgi:hypothetical protein